MKKYKLIILLMIISGVNAFTQKPFRELSETYKQQKQYFATELSKRTINLYLKEKNPQKEVREVLDKIDNLKVLSFSMSGTEHIPSFIEDVYNKYQLVKYQPFKVSRGMYENKLIFLKESENYISDLLLVNTSISKVSLIEIQGKIDIEKISLLRSVLNISELDALSNISDKHQMKGVNSNVEDDLKNRNKVDNHQKMNVPSKGGVKVYNRNGVELIGTNNDPYLMINGYASAGDFQASLRQLNPDCIQSINILKDQEANRMGHPDGMIEVQLRGNNSEIFTVCEGTLYFGQDGYIQTVKIDDECGPNLLVDCTEKPLSDIEQLKPQQIKSIKLTTDPRNCKGKLEGEYVVLETE